MRSCGPGQINNRTLESWVPFRDEGSSVRFRVFCVPHAGGNAAFYLPLRKVMPPQIDFCPLELPGHVARLDEPPIDTMHVIIERLDHVLKPLLTLPFGFFGHSVGALIAYEAARTIKSSNGGSAVHLFVSGCAGPKVSLINRSRTRLRSDEELVSVLRRFGGTPAAIMQRPELLAALLPALRADIALAEEYAVNEVNGIECPVTAFGGSDDVSMAGLQSWRGQTSGAFRVFMLPGGHFYFSPGAKALANEIERDLLASVSPRAANGLSQT